MRRATWSRPTSRPARSRNLDRRSERGNQMKTGEIERGNAPRFIPQNIPHTDPTVHDRTDKGRRKTQEISTETTLDDLRRRTDSHLHSAGRGFESLSAHQVSDPTN